MQFAAFFKIYKMCTLLHRSKFNILAKNRLFRDTAPALQKQNRFNKSGSSTASGFLSLGPGDAIEGAWLEALRKDREALQKAPKPAQQVSRRLIYQLVEELNEDDRTQFLSKCW